MKTILSGLGLQAGVLLLSAVTSNGEALANRQAGLQDVLELSLRDHACELARGAVGCAGLEDVNQASVNQAYVNQAYVAKSERTDAADSVDVHGGPVSADEAGLALEAAILESPARFRHPGVQMLLANGSQRRALAARQETASQSESAEQGSVDSAPPERSKAAATHEPQLIAGASAGGFGELQNTTAATGQTPSSWLDSSLFAFVAWLTLLALGGLGVGGLSRVFGGRPESTSVESTYSGSASMRVG